MTFLVFVVLFSGCGGGTATVIRTETHEVTVAPAPRTATGASTSGAGTGPVMPNVDETAAAVVTDVALKAYEAQWGDGSGVHAVWGPNIVSGWALIGVENLSGAAGKDVLLHEENGTWKVKDIGHALSVTWGDQTPPSLWPTP